MATYSIDKIKYGSNTYKLSPEATEIMNLIYPIGSIYMSVNNVSPQTFLGGTWQPINGRFLVAQGSNGSSGNDALNLTAGNSGGYTNPQNSAHSHAKGTLAADSTSTAHTHDAGTLAADSTNLAHTHTTGTHYHTLSAHTHGVGNTDSTHYLSRNNDSGTQTRSAVGTSGSAYTWRGTTAGGFNSFANTGAASGLNNATSTGYSTKNATTGALSGTPNTGAMSKNADHGHTISGSTGDMSANGTHTHTISGSTDSVSAVTSGNLPPYLAVYMWKRTA